VRAEDFNTSGSRAIEPGDVMVLLAPWDEGSSYARGPAQAPARIEAALFSPARNLGTESGLDLGTIDRIRFLSLAPRDLGEAGLHLAEQAATQIATAGARLLTLGGDHSITPAVLRPFASDNELTVVQIDAHPDLYDEFEGRRDSHACPMARILEQGRVHRLIQIGIRASTPVQQAQARRFGVETLAPEAWSPQGLAELGIRGSVYLTLDLDGLDPAYAPGVSHPEPGGLSTRQVIEILQTLPGTLVAADLVELNPLRDVGDLTAVTAAKLCKEILARFLAEDHD